MRKWQLFGLWMLLVGLLWTAREETVLPAGGAAELAETKYVALTFDDGPRPGTTDRLLDGLKERGARATFFLIGEDAAVHPELVQRMKEEGHQVGNHTWSHVRLDETARGAALSEVTRTDELLRSLLGEGDYWLRPPYGFVDKELMARIQVPLVKWSVDPRDWESRNTEKVVQAVLKDTKPNSIVLLHDIYDTSVDAALRVIDALKKEGYQFVTVEELLWLNGVEPRPGTMYRSGNG